MPLPGTTVSLLDVPPPISAPTDTTVWFVAGLTDQGPLFPVKVRSMAEFTARYGPRVTYSVLYDALDVFFREGGSSAYVSRVVGPAPTFGSKTLLDGVAAVSLTVTAIGPGAYSTGIKVGVVAGQAGGSYQIQVTDLTNVVLDQSGDLLTQNDAVNWGLQSNYVRIALGASLLNPVVVAPAALSAGTDDRANVTETQWLNAINAFTIVLGPGQVSMPGRSTDAAHVNLLAHAQANRRVALLDLADTAVVATLTTAVTNARIGNQRYGATFAPWLLAPGVFPSTIRTIPPSALVAGLIARNEDELGPDAPAAGDRGIARYINGLSQAVFTDAQRQVLNDGGVNVILNRFGNMEVYGWRSLVNALIDPNWLDFGNSRLYMAIAADADELAEQFVFGVIDGQGKLQSEFGGALAAMLMRYYTQGALFGATPDDAFYVDVGPQVNTPATIQANELHALLNIRMSPMAEVVVIQIVKTPVTQAVS
jgi:phage tail sheath protein FI